MKNLELKSFGSSYYDLESWRPSRAEDVFFILDMEIGQQDVEGADLFYVTVATPEGLRKHGRVASTTSQGPLVLAVYSLDLMIERVNQIIADCADMSWHRSVLSLRRHFDYEYEDYKP